ASATTALRAFGVRTGRTMSMRSCGAPRRGPFRPDPCRIHPLGIVGAGSHVPALMRYSDFMDEPAADTLTTVAAGRAETVARLRQLAAALEALPLDAVAEVLGAARARAPRPAAP